MASAALVTEQRLGSVVPCRDRARGVGLHDRCSCPCRHDAPSGARPPCTNGSMQTRPTPCVAVVTGANHGIGAATAVALAAARRRRARHLPARRRPDAPAADATTRTGAQDADEVLAADRGPAGRGARRSRPTCRDAGGRRRCSTRPSAASGRSRSSSTTPAAGVADTFVRRAPTARPTVAPCRRRRSTATSASMPAPARC